MSDPLVMSAVSLEYVRVAVDAGTIDPTGDTVAMAFVADGNPGPADWKAATWETTGGIHYARCLVGPGGTVALAVGRWRVFVKVTDNPEIPALHAGQLHLT